MALQQFLSEFFQFFPTNHHFTFTPRHHSSPSAAWDGPNQAAHYHILGSTDLAFCWCLKMVLFI
jgi:hypothetical protein